MSQVQQQTFTITFSEGVENHRGMQQIGHMAEQGYSVQTLREIAARTPGAEFIQLNTLTDQPEAAVVILRDGLQTVFGISPIDCFAEQAALDKDTKAFMYGRVVNKKARYNLCFADFDQEAKFEEKKGTVVNFTHVPILAQLRAKLGTQFGPEFANLNAEGNYYYDIKKTYIGFHQDDERKKVVGLRLGSTFPLHYRWHHKGEPQEIITIQLNAGDIYIMSEEAKGRNWKRRSVPWHIRHAAGDLKHL